MTLWLKDQNLQLLIGLILLVLPVFYFVISGASWQPLDPHEHVIQNGLAYLFLVIFSYVNHTIFVPRWFLNKRYRLYLTVAISCVLAAAYLPYRIEQWVYFKPPQQPTISAWARQLFVEELMLSRPDGPHRPPRSEPGLPPDRTSKTTNHTEFPHRFSAPGRHPDMLILPVKLTLFFLLGSISTLISISIQTASRLRQVETDQLQAELQQLRAQIQPHFLFNTLNSIYALALRNDTQTADTVVKLSEFMRYIIRDAHRDKVALRNEVNYIENYIDLQKVRLRDAVQIDYQLTGQHSALTIAPLLLFSFIENAFKYGVSPDEDSRITIRLTLHENNLSLYVANGKVQLNPLERSTGVGLQNARERLRLLYPDAHRLAINSTPTAFYVHLTLSLSE